MANETTAAWGDAIWQMNTIDFLRSGALLVAFLATGFSDRRGKGAVWLHADQIACVAFGIGFCFFPNTFLPYVMVGKADWLHAALLQSVGHTLLACAATWWFSSRSREATASWSLARVLACLTLLQVLYYSEWKYAKHAQRLTTQHHTFGTFGAILLTIGHLLCLFRVYGSVSERSIPRQWNRENACVLFLVMFMLIDCLVLYSRPHILEDIVIQKGWKMDGVHLCLLRVCCSQLMSLFFFATFALLNLNKHDHVAVLVGGMLAYGVLLLGFEYYEWKYTFLSPAVRQFSWISVGIIVSVCAFGSLRELRRQE